MLVLNNVSFLTVRFALGKKGTSATKVDPNGTTA